jgi:hypothetical protein
MQWHASAPWTAPGSGSGYHDPYAPARFREQARRCGRWLRWVMVGAALYALLGYVLMGVFLHGARHDLFTTNPDGTPHVSSGIVTLQLVTTPMSLFSFAFIGVLIAWIFQAGKFAEAMGWPTVRSRTLGAWSVIIPIVNFWFPYEALRDAYPPESSHSALLRWWLTYVLIPLPLAIAVFVVALTASGAATAIVIALTVLPLGLTVVFGWQAIDELDAAQARATVS